MHGTGRNIRDGNGELLSHSPIVSFPRDPRERHQQDVTQDGGHHRDGGGGGSSRPIRAHPNTLREKAQLAQHTKSVRTRKLEHKLKWEKELDDAAQQSDGGGTPVAHSPRQPKSPRGKRK